MADNASELDVLASALDQLGGLVDGVTADQRALPTPCPGWTLDQLLAHVVTGVGNFARGVRGEQVDWGAESPALGDDPGMEFRARADDLLAAWRDAAPEAEGPPPTWQCAELAVHTWDLATALGRPTSELDPEVARAGLGFMRAGLTDENRGDAFGPERPAPEGADPYQEIAAFAGREV